MRHHENVPVDQLPVGLDDAERVRLEAMMANDAEALRKLTTGGMRFIDERGAQYSRDDYIAAVEEGRLGYGPSVQLHEDYNYLEGLVFIAVGRMVALEAEDMFESERRYSATWIEHTNGWRLLLVQETPLQAHVLGAPSRPRLRARRRAPSGGTSSA